MFVHCLAAAITPPRLLSCDHSAAAAKERRQAHLLYIYITAPSGVASHRHHTAAADVTEVESLRAAEPGQPPLSLNKTPGPGLSPQPLFPGTEGGSWAVGEGRLLYTMTTGHRVDSKRSSSEVLETYLGSDGLYGKGPGGSLVFDIWRSMTYQRADCPLAAQRRRHSIWL
ncbi:unnamed protein product [Arctogadus glacialis]